MATPQTPVLLNSWKEIASYLGRGVRTVQRYEREHQLPVRRVQSKSHSAVLAFTTELDAWLRRTRLQKLEPSATEALRNEHLLEEHRKAISRLEYGLLVLYKKLAEGQRIRLRQRWFGGEDE